MSKSGLVFFLFIAGQQLIAITSQPFECAIIQFRNTEFSFIYAKIKISGLNGIAFNSCKTIYHLGHCSYAAME